jgi:pimeloyl-ACP methyl ester carboxylesterase
MDTITSTDRTPIAYWTSGDGPPLVLVHGATTDHHRWLGVLPLLEPHLTVHAIDRRGRGGSGDGPEYAVDREFEDVAAVVRAVADRTGGPVDLLGHSFGALCALGGARLAGDSLRRLVLYEPPVAVQPAPDLVGRLEALLAQERQDEALQLFFREEVRVPPEELAMLRGLPAWPARVAAAHTLPRELGAVVDFDPAPEWFRPVTVPALLLLGGDSPPPMAGSVELVRHHLSDARVEVMPGQQHVAMDTAPELFSKLVVAFLSAREGSDSSRKLWRRVPR